MRNRLLTMLGLFSVTLAINAQDEKAWDVPSPTRAQFVNAPENGKHYLIYNTEAGGFMCNALAWATQSCVSATRANTYLLETKEIYNRATGRPRMGTGGWTIKTINYIHWKKGEVGNGRDGDCPNISDKYVFIDSPTGSFQDMGSQGHNYFDFVAQGDGTYRLRAIATDDKYGKGVTGWDYDNTWFGVQKPEEGIEPAAFTAITPQGNAEDYYVAWKFADASVYLALCDLYDALEANNAAAEDSKVEDVDAYVAVYNNAASTVADIEKAIADLAQAVKDKVNAEFNEKIKEASEDNPVDITEMIQNASFNGNANGWDNTFVKGKNATNLGYQGANYANGDVKIDKFMEAWANQSFRDGVDFRCLGDGQLSQTLKDMPAGKYRLTVDCISNQQDGRANPATGVELFCSSGEFESSQNLSTDNGKPEHFEVEFLCVGGELTVGLRTKNATANWIAADNFQLYFMGALGPDENPAKIDLNGVIKSYAKWDEDSDSYTEYVANADVNAAWKTALTAAKDATGDFPTYKEELQAAASALAASIKDYEALDAAIKLCDTKSDLLREAGFVAAEELLGDLHDTWTDAYNDCTYTHEDIEGLNDLLIDAINESVSRNVEPGMDVTVLLNNPGFDKDFSGWTVSGSTPGWGGNGVWDNVAIPNEVEGGLQPADLGSGNAEKWHAAFDISQVIKGMPAGIYTLSCQAFERSDDGNPLSAVLYAVINGKEQTVPVKELTAESSPEPLFLCDQTDANKMKWQSDAENTVLGGYMPNGMCGANVYFAKGFYKNKFVFVVDEPTDITVGLKTPSDKNWILFDDFRIVYEGMTVEPLREVLQNLCDNVSEAIEVAESDVVATTPAMKDIQTALVDGESSLSKETVEELQAAYNDLTDAYKAFQLNMTTLPAFRAKLEAMTEACDSLYTNADEPYVEDPELIAAGTQLVEEVYGQEIYMDYTTAQLNEAIAESDSLTKEMLKWVSFQNFISNTFLVNGKEYIKVVEDEELAAEYQAAEAVVETKEYTKVTAELADYQAELKALLDKMVIWDDYAKALKRELPAGWEEASDDNLYEFTDYVMKNANLNKGADQGWSWTKEAQNGPRKDNGPVDGSNCMEFWNPTAKGNTFDFNQTIFGLPEGRYMLWVTAMVSKNGEVFETEEPTEDEIATVSEEAEGHSDCPKLYAHIQNGAAEKWHATPILTVLDENPEAEIAATGDHDYCVYFDVPAAAEDATRGVEVTVGVKSCGNIGGRWFVADDFQLIYYGKASSKPLTDADAIQQVSNAAVLSTTIYNLSGAQQRRLQPGVNIIKTTLVDGTVRTAKVLVK